MVCSGGNGFPVESLEIVGQGFLVVLDREQVVRALFLDQEAGGLALGVERIGGDHTPLDGEGIEQLPQGRDLITLGLDRALCQDGALPREQGGEQMRLAAIAPASALEGLAVDGQGFVGRGASLDPGGKGLLQRHRIHLLEHAAEGGLGGGHEALLSAIEIGPQALELRLGQAGGVLTDGQIAPGAGQGGRQGDGQHRRQGVQLTASTAGFG